MSEESDAARKYAAQFSGFMKACAKLGEIENLDEAHRAGMQRYEEDTAKHAQFLVEAKNEVDSYQTRIAEMAGQVKKTEDDVIKMRKRGQDDAAAIVAAAKAEAETIIAAAKDSAGKIFADAHEVAVKVVAEAKAKADSAAGGLADITTKTEAGKQKLGEIHSRIAEATGREAAIEAHIAELKGM